ncbi:MAG: membrane protein insertion efficiency factor YidD [Candidatus Omnitrophota bacterium]
MLTKAMLGIICFYRKCVRPYLPTSCIYNPTCSEYAIQAITKYGWLKGSLMAAARLGRCHPLSGRSGFDPVK